MPKPLEELSKEELISLLHVQGALLTQTRMLLQDTIGATYQTPHWQQGRANVLALILKETLC